MNAALPTANAHTDPLSHPDALRLLETLAEEAIVSAESFAFRTEQEMSEVKRRDEERNVTILRAALTHARRANEGLREGLMSLIETSVQPTFVISHNGEISLWNAAIRQLTGLSIQKAFGQNYRDLFGGEGLGALRDILGETLSQGTLPGGLESTAVRHLEEAFVLVPGTSPVTVTLLPVCLLSSCLEMLIVLCEPIK